jgi:hypothetical protein
MPRRRITDYQVRRYMEAMNSGTVVAGNDGFTLHDMRRIDDARDGR